MRIGLDGFPLLTPLTGVGHYTLELARALALLAPSDQFELVAPGPFPGSIIEDIRLTCPDNLRAFTVEANSIHRRRWWAVGLPLYLRKASLDLFHGTNYRVAVTPFAPRSGFQAMPAKQARQTKERLGIEDEFVLFVGTIEPRKNLLVLMRAFDQILRQTSRRPQLVVVGAEGWLMDELFAFIKQSSISDRLLLTGYLDDDDLRALYSSCTVFVYPSIYEGFGLPPLEAMACGAPVIAGNIATFQETLGSAAQLVEPNDVEAFARSIVEILDDEDRRRALSRRGLEQAAKFSWQRTAKLTLEVYREILRRT